MTREREYACAPFETTTGRGGDTHRQSRLTLREREKEEHWECVFLTRVGRGEKEEKKIFFFSRLHWVSGFFLWRNFERKKKWQNIYIFCLQRGYMKISWKNDWFFVVITGWGYLQLHNIDFYFSCVWYKHGLRKGRYCFSRGRKGWKSV